MLPAPAAGTPSSILSPILIENAPLEPAGLREPARGREDGTWLPAAVGEAGIAPDTGSLESCGAGSWPVRKIFFANITGRFIISAAPLAPSNRRDGCHQLRILRGAFSCYSGQSRCS